MTPKEKALNSLGLVSMYSNTASIDYDLLIKSYDIALQEQAKQIFDNLKSYELNIQTKTGLEYIEFRLSAFDCVKNKWCKK